MVGVAQRDHFVAAPVEGGQENRRFVRLGAGTGEEDLVQLLRRHFADALGQFDLGADQKEGRGVDDAVELRLDRVVDLGNGVTADDGGDAAEEVEILPAIAIVQVLPFPGPDLDRLLVEERDAREERFPVAARST